MCHAGTWGPPNWLARESSHTLFFHFYDRQVAKLRGLKEITRLIFGAASAVSRNAALGEEPAAVLLSHWVLKSPHGLESLSFGPQALCSLPYPGNQEEYLE